MLFDRTVQIILAAASSAPDESKAAAAIVPLLNTLRRGLETLEFDRGDTPMIRTYSPPDVRPGEPPARTAERLQYRIDDLHLARRLGGPGDAERVIRQAVDEVRIAALGGCR